jgi:hypothetical protein
MRIRSLINLGAVVVWVLSQAVIGYAQHALGSGSDAAGLGPQATQFLSIIDGTASAGRDFANMSTADTASHGMRGNDRHHPGKSAYQGSDQCETACQGVISSAGGSLLRPLPAVKRYRLADDTGISYLCSLPTPPPNHSV